jgi:hypothetical protein
MRTLTLALFAALIATPAGAQPRYYNYNNNGDDSAQYQQRYQMPQMPTQQRPLNCSWIQGPFGGAYYQACQ